MRPLEGYESRVRKRACGHFWCRNNLEAVVVFKPYKRMKLSVHKTSGKATRGSNLLLHRIQDDSCAVGHSQAPISISNSLHLTQSRESVCFWGANVGAAFAAPKQ